MPPRIRAHKKVRTGCKTCRKRRVKCDETHPVCRNCTSREVACVWADDLAATKDPPKPGLGATTSANTPTLQPPPPPYNPNDDYTEFLRLFSLPPTPPPLPPGGEQSLDLQSLELLHHYTHSTHTTLPSSNYAHDIWRTVVPRLALRCDYLMHALLAITALHVSTIGNPQASASYGLLAARHYHKASVGLRGALLGLTTEDSGNETIGNALFLTSSFISIYAVANAKCARGQLPAAFAWIPLIRGVHLVLKGCYDAVKGGELGPLLQVRRGRRVIAMEGQAEDLPEYLDSIYLVDSEWPDLDDIRYDPGLRKIYREVVEKLRELWEIAIAEESRVFIWPIILSERFMGLLMELQPRALVILAHYCVFLAILGELWWVRGRAAEELETIGGLLDHRWNRWLEWPLRHVYGMRMVGGGRIE